MFDFIRELFPVKQNIKEKSSIELLQGKEKNKIPVIDVSQSSQRAMCELLASLDKIEIYDALFRLNENDRHEIMKMAYEQFNYHGISKSIYEKYSQYDKEVITYITIKEKRRIQQRVKIYHYSNMLNHKNAEETWYRFFANVDGSLEEDLNGALCQFNDALELNLTNIGLEHWEGGYDRGLDIMGIQPCLGRDKKWVKLYYNKELHILAIEEFKKYREKNNLKLYLTMQEKYESTN